MADTDELTHFTLRGEARMVDVGEKPVTRRRALAEGRLYAPPDALARLREGSLPKGDALAVARIAAIQGAKRTAELIPLCHPLPLDRVEAQIAVEAEYVSLRVEARAEARTGVEMEALTGASVGILALYDMLKALGHDLRFEVRLLEKDGGTHGLFRAEPR